MTRAARPAPRRAAAPALPVALVALGVLVGCGAGGAGDDSNYPDASSTGDASGCSIGVTYDPASPFEGETVTATAYVPEANGFLDYAWELQTSGGALVPFEQATSDLSQIRFTAPAAGPLYVTLDVSGSGCFGYGGSVNIRALGAQDTPWRVRFSPPPGLGAPPQERSVIVSSGAPFEWPSQALDPGIVASGSIVDGAGAPVAAYLRLSPAGAPELMIDGFAGSDGAYAIRALVTPHDLLIVPFRADLAPRRIASWLPGTEAITVDAGVAVTGTVHDPADQPLAGAIVTVKIAGVTSSVGTTDGAGAFTVRARPIAGGAVEVSVVPPVGTGLPRLQSAAAVLDTAQPLAIRYQPGVATRDVAGAVAQLGGAPAASGRVTFVGTVADAGVVAVGLAQAVAQGSFAIPVATDGGGALASQAVPAAAATAVVEAGAGAGLVTIDLTAATPATIAAAAPATVTARVVDADGAPVAGADVRAVPVDALAAAVATQVHVTSAADGTVAMPLAGGGGYQVVVVDRGGGHALRRAAVVASSTDLGDLALPDGLRFTGTISLQGATPSGVAVTVYCQDCAAADRARPAAEAATDDGGRFRATLVDPGVAP
ncbi:MAG: carboxypeptidase regulatory-like domain-containing protein [Kofleriaceae bacterium]|nr:carboxypeptidase regulatory-like domain-containing protein [Kofleriaceae bacterium]MCB9573730.1 carboxypeptidase regulatory-like domain-containing protein [Kofleriaceae bacterium]